MLGVGSTQIKSYKHDTLPAFGMGAEKGEPYWRSLVRQAVINGFLAKDIEKLWSTKNHRYRKSLFTKAYLVYDDHRPRF